MNDQSISLDEVHLLTDAVFEVTAIETWELQPDPSEPHADDHVILVDAKHHRARKGRVRFGLVLDRSTLEDLELVVQEILDRG